MKTCIVCEEAKPSADFYTVMKRGKPYTMAHCKSCHAVRLHRSYKKHQEKNNARSVAWMRANHDRWREICSKSAGAYYHKVQSPLAQRACRLFEKMTDNRRVKFALAILNNETYPWVKAKRVHALDDWLGAYAGI